MPHESAEGPRGAGDRRRAGPGRGGGARVRRRGRRRRPGRDQPDDRWRQVEADIREGRPGAGLPAGHHRLRRPTGGRSTMCVAWGQDSISWSTTPPSPSTPPSWRTRSSTGASRSPSTWRPSTWARSWPPRTWSSRAGGGSSASLPVQGFVSSGMCGAYNAAKGGIIALTKSMAVELAPYNILVNAVAPGFMLTPMSIVDGVDETQTPDFQDWYVAKRKIPMARTGYPEDDAGAVVFLALGVLPLHDRTGAGGGWRPDLHLLVWVGIGSCCARLALHALALPDPDAAGAGVSRSATRWWPSSTSACAASAAPAARSSAWRTTGRSSRTTSSMRPWRTTPCCCWPSRS